MAELRLEGISKSWGERTVLSDINLEIPDGEFWVLVGPSGCGKSTILRLIAGLETPTTGNLWIGDRLVNGIPARQRDVAMVFQNYALYPHMTVAENLGFGLKMRGMDQRTISDRITAVAKSLKIEHLLHRKPAQLSGGQQQRVALGRAIIRAPQIFLMDEPLSNLDPQLRDSTRAELKLLHQHIGITTVYVTHDQTEAMTLADQIVVLDQGRIQQIGRPLEIYEQPANLMVASFFGNPPMNLLTARFRDGLICVGEQYFPCPKLTKGWQLPSNLKLGIRCEHLEWSTTPSPNSLVMQVILREPLGNTTILRACLPEDPTQWIHIQVPSHLCHLPLETKIWVSFPASHLYLFDGDSGDRLL
jgi:multiple sugar transport system ATP-binding protein